MASITKTVSCQRKSCGCKYIPRKQYCSTGAGSTVDAVRRVGLSDASTTGAINNQINLTRSPLLYLSGF